MNTPIEVRRNLRLARGVWGELSRTELQGLKVLIKKYALSVGAGDVRLLEGRWYITHAGLLRIAQQHRCSSIRTALQKSFCDPPARRWVFKATVYKSGGTKGFVGFGDADPSNVSPLVHGAEMRVAETRAVNRALRKAYGIGLCSVEELGAFSSSPAAPARSKQNGSYSTNGHGSTGQPRLRDRLCLLIRQHQLDSNLVKQYAAEFCGTAELREASRDMVEAFIEHLSKAALEDRDGLIAKLNTFSHPQEVHS